MKRKPTTATSPSCYCKALTWTCAVLGQKVERFLAVQTQLRAHIASTPCGTLGQHACTDKKSPAHLRRPSNRRVCLGSHFLQALPLHWGTVVPSSHLACPSLLGEPSFPPGRCCSNGSPCVRNAREVATAEQLRRNLLHHNRKLTCRERYINLFKSHCLILRDSGHFGPQGLFEFKKPASHSYPVSSLVP